MSNSNEYIKDDRVIPFLSDVIKEINEKGRTECVPRTIFQDSLLIQDIFNVNDQNIDIIFAKIQKSPMEYRMFTEIIEYAIKIRPCQNKYLFDLLYKISILTKISLQHYILLNYRNKLIKKGIIRKKDLDDSFDSEECIIKAIRKDSVIELIELSARSDFNPQGILKFSSDNPIFFVNEDINEDSFHKEDTEVTFMQLMAYYGAIKCFKWALIDGSFDGSNLSMYAIAGGNNEIIHLIEQKGDSFDNCFEVSVKYHRNDLNDWLLRNYKCESFKLWNTIEYFNIPAFYFLFKNNISTSDISIDRALIMASKHGLLSIAIFSVNNGAEIEAALKYACKYGHINIVRYLIDNGANIENLGEENPLFEASENNHWDIVIYLIDHGANIEARNMKGCTLLHYASRSNNINVVRYLIDKGANIEAKDNNEATPLHYASRYSNIDVIGYLIDKGANIEAKDKDGQTPLYYASDFRQNDAVKFLIDRGADIKSICKEEVDETGFDEVDIHMIVDLTNCTRTCAIKMLRETKNDLVQAVMNLP